MSAARIYMDYNATAPLREEAGRAMADAFAIYGNPSSVHAEGRRARAAVERARAQVAALVNGAPGDVVFTGGGTEANNMALRQDAWELRLVSAVEHDSVLAPARAGGAHETIPVLEDGRVDTNWLDMRLASTSGDARVVIAVQAANNETGVIQPIEAVGAIAAARGCALHIDAVQAAGRVTLDFPASGAAFMALSAHKIGGPKGVGALVVRGDRKLASLTRGGGQERGRRAGTENVAGIVGFGVAAELAMREMTPGAAKAARLRDRLEAGVRAATPGALVIGEAGPRLANTSCVALPGARAETLVIALDLEGVAVSAGAACSSGKVSRSHVLDAMGISGDVADAAIRVSIGPDTREQDIDRFLDAWVRVTATGIRRDRASVASVA